MSRPFSDSPSIHLQRIEQDTLPHVYVSHINDGILYPSIEEVPQHKDEEHGADGIREEYLDSYCPPEEAKVTWMAYDGVHASRHQHMRGILPRLDLVVKIRRCVDHCETPKCLAHHCDAQACLSWSQGECLQASSVRAPLCEESSAVPGGTRVRRRSGRESIARHC
jgi:hypothetical protein